MKMKAIFSVVYCAPFLAFADPSTPPPPFLSGDPINENQIPSGYPQSAAYATKGWGVFLTADYLCWKWNQPLAPISVITVSDSVLSEQFINKNTTINDLNPQYKSGFQVGLGFNMRGMDNWNVFAEYTWYQNSISSNFTTGPKTAFTRSTPGSQFASYYQKGNIERHANMHFNALDASLQRPFYFGKKITSNFGIGLSNLWITQQLNGNFDVLLLDRESELPVLNISTSKSKQTSWSIGPKVQFESNWLLGYGIHFIGNISASVLYTKYIWETNTSSYLKGLVTEETVNTRFFRNTGTYNFVPTTQTQTGIGWGSYLSNQKFHLDLSVLYDVNIYWNYTNLQLENPQNMMLHGLNIRARFDF